MKSLAARETVKPTYVLSCLEDKNYAGYFEMDESL